MKNNSLKVFQANTYTMSKQTFNVNEKRVMQFIIAKIKPTDTEFKRYEIPIVEIADMAKISTANMYPFAKTLMVDMLSKFIILQDEKKRMKGFNYFTELVYENGILTVELNRNIHHLFLQLIENKVNFTAYELTEFMTISSSHAQRIYELVKQYSKSKQREREIPIIELKKMLNIEDKYKLYANFRKVVLEYSHNHIEEHTNLRYKWEGITKRGRKVVAIRFYEIHEAGKESPTKIQEHAIMLDHVGENIHIKEFNLYIKIKEIEKAKDKSYSIKAPDGTWYKFKNNKALKEGIKEAFLMDAKMRVQGSLFDL
jgi:plasmid replication initiation protein